MCNKPECKEIPIKDCCKYNGPSYPQLGIEQGMSYEDVFSAISSYVETIQTTDGETGPQGIPGEDGIGITSVVNNSDGTLTFTFSNGSTYTTPSLTGPSGPTGLSLTYKFSNSASTSPGSGFFTADTGDFSSATSVLTFNTFDQLGEDVTDTLGFFENPDEGGNYNKYGQLIISSTSNINRRVVCEVVGYNVGTEVEVTILSQQSNPLINPLTNNNDFTITFIPSDSVTKTIVIPYYWQVITSGYLHNLPISSLSAYGLTDYAKIVDLKATVTTGIAGQPVFPIDSPFPVPGDPAGSIFATDTNIVLQAVTGRFFDNVFFDNLLQRGHITITFLK